MREKIFFSYVKKDKQWLEKIQIGLQPYLGQIPHILWDEMKIPPGKDWREETKQALSSAKVAVLLVSPTYLASDFIAKQILPPLLDAAKNDGLTILWIAVHKCSYEVTKIERYKAVNDPSKPLASLKRPGELDDALLNICQQIANAANQELEKPTNTLVVNVDVPVITIKGEPAANRAKIQQIIEEYFDVNACFVRLKELNDLFKNVLNGSSRIFQSAHGAGKTALLKQLQILCEKESIPVKYIDFSTLKGPVQTTLWRNVCLVLTNAESETISPEEVEIRLAPKSLATRAVICLDNVDALADNLRISIEQEMRHLASLVRWLKTYHTSTSELSVILTIHAAFDVHKHASGYTSPWFTQFGGFFPLEELSEGRSVEMLRHAGIIDEAQIAFCVNRPTHHRLPLDLLLLACLLKEYVPADAVDYELLEAIYLQLEPLLRS